MTWTFSGIAGVDFLNVFQSNQMERVYTHHIDPDKAPEWWRPLKKGHIAMTARLARYNLDGVATRTGHSTRSMALSFVAD